ncbi:hypothetical protein VNO77_11990 [Canavalia gladiata]|uniref:Uncharacterized protein n=1 Tax=Canavalia gladiata TaxID=3824 RepID=A0AAN9M069_CANGL
MLLLSGICGDCFPNVCCLFHNLIYFAQVSDNDFGYQSSLYRARLNDAVRTPAELEKHGEWTEVDHHAQF